MFELFRSGLLQIDPDYSKPIENGTDTEFEIIKPALRLYGGIHLDDECKETYFNSGMLYQVTFRCCSNESKQKY